MLTIKQESDLHGASARSGKIPAVPLELFNTLSGKIETLAPVGAPALRMYACGPTVYDYGHIGNFRTFLHVDVLRRFLKQLGHPIQHVMNITDVDDKIIRNALAANLPIAEYSAKYEQAFFEDLDSLSIERPEHLPRATEHIPEMVSLIERLAAKDMAYQAEGGSWYFRIARDPDYGKLAKKDLASIEDGARVDVDEYDKDHARDFALWKAVKPATAEHHWQTPLGPGRPGWHIECSAIRFLLISVPYRHQLNFTFDGLTQATNAVERLRTFHLRLLRGTWPDAPSNRDLAAQIAASQAAYTAALSSDLNTAEAHAAVFDMVRAVNAAADAGTLYAPEARAARHVLNLFDAIFAVLEDRHADLTRAALAWAEREGRLDEADPGLVATLSLTDQAIEALIAERAQVKKQRNFARADAIRKDLLAKGILLKDTSTGTEWTRK